MKPRTDPIKRYQEKALTCLLGVHDMQDPAARVAMLQLARAWIRLARYHGDTGPAWHPTIDIGDATNLRSS